jgi:hypothetical protein
MTQKWVQNWVQKWGQKINPKNDPKITIFDDFWDFYKNFKKWPKNVKNRGFGRFLKISQKTPKIDVFSSFLKIAKNPQIRHFYQ